ncbi:hypothetical protein CBS101457_001926 [Exobasidium rhododendri]|nr:hypothetical protein CBS101457_001926 [Exobasidium rhododendri]
MAPKAAAKEAIRRKRPLPAIDAVQEAETLPPAVFDEDAIDSLEGGELELGQEAEEESEGSEDEESEEANADSEADLDPFPEIDARSSDGEDYEEEFESDSIKVKGLETDKTEEGDDEEEEGYDSEDIDNWDEEEEDALADELANRETDDSEIEEELSKMISRATQKPEEGEKRYNKLGMTADEAAPSIFSKGRNPDGSARGQFKISEITGHPKRVYPAIEADYESDSSTEDAPNRIGDVPMEWYDDFPHIGYDVEGRKVLRPATGDELDKFLATVEDPDAWTSAQDRLLGKNVKLSDEELDIIRRLQNAEIPDSSYNPYEPTTEWYTGKGMEMVMPLSSRPEPKSRFVPSKWEHKKVMKIVRAIRQGRIKPRGPVSSSRPNFYNIWSEADQAQADHPMHMPAPKLPLPTHAESYNPPAEYLFNESEKKEWEEAEASDRKSNFIPAKSDALRKVPGYQNFVQERFERCLDLYLAPRMRRQRLDISDAQSLIPKLPSPRELRPFPTTSAVVYKHPDSVRVRSLAVDPRGAWLVTGADDGRVRLWDLTIGRCAMTWDLHSSTPAGERAPVFSVKWCPNKAYSIFAACTYEKVVVFVPPQSNALNQDSEEKGANWTSPSMAFATQGYQPVVSSDGPIKTPPAKWLKPTEGEKRRGIAAIIQVRGTPKQVVWHNKGDYFSTVTSSTEGSSASSSAVLIHQLSKQRSQAPFAKASKGSSIQKVLFHPFLPHFFVATQRTIRIYNLSTQSLLKTLQPGLKWISSMHIHKNSGNHLIVGSYDKRVAWFDLELANRPYKILRYHQRAVRGVEFHDNYPLFMSVSDDGNAHVLHSTIYNDLVTNPLIVPLKVLRGHAVKEGLGVIDATWHPFLPWLVTAGADGDARLWTP